MSFNALPPELILIIGEHCPSQGCLLALSITNKYHNQLLTRLLIPFNIKHDRSSGLTYAAKRNNIPLAMKFLDAKADPDTRVVTHTEAHAVHDSAEFQQIEESGMLETPLYLAVSGRFEEMVNLLLQHGADPWTVAWRGGYPNALCIAIADRETEIMKALLKVIVLAAGFVKLPS
ncbi:hypothetical protein BDW59DRAFT_167227 [Aspergillus cavernicola]|uniref:Ankyrin repeat-containing domain protein n=1 Tax=Aspergillus cavernicola TaxID=176166 RepID=A0ABR4HFU7_9EURO